MRKYAIILPDGAADFPLPQLGGRTPLEAADIPNMDWVARHGRLGRVVTVPAGFTPGTDIGTLTLLGFDPRRYYTGRAPIEAAARGLTAGPDELIFRCNFVTIRDGRMKDFTADHIHQPETERLIADLNTLFAGEPCRFHAGISYRNLMIASQVGDMQLKSAPPHDIPDQPAADHLPLGRGQERIRSLMTRAAAMLKDHEVNRARAAQRRPPVTDIWLWGQGRPTTLETFQARFGVRGAAITAVDIIRGFANLTGLDLIDVPGATGYIDTNYVGKGEAAVRALDTYDLIVVHVESADEAAHLGNAEEKVRALERIDTHVVGPLLEKLRRFDAWRILIAPDHYTPVSTTAHDATPPPFCYAGSDVATGAARPFSEPAANAVGRLLDPGHTLLAGFFGDARPG